MADLILGKVSHRQVSYRFLDKRSAEASPHQGLTGGTDNAETGTADRVRPHHAACRCDGVFGEQPPPGLRTLITHLASVLQCPA